MVLNSSDSETTRSSAFSRRFSLFQDAGVVGEHHALQLTQDAIRFRGGRGVQRRMRLGVQSAHLGGVERRRRQPFQILDGGSSRDPAIADAKSDVEAGEVVGAAGLRQPRRQADPARRSGSQRRCGCPSWSSG